MNSIFNYGINFDDIVQINRIYKIEDQRCISNCNYGYFIKIDGKEIHSVVNSNIIQFCNVKIYPFKNYFYYYLFRLAPVTIGAKKEIGIGVFFYCDFDRCYSSKKLVRISCSKIFILWHSA